MQYEGAKEVDGSLLIMPIVFFIEENDPKWVSTLDRIREQLGDGAHIWRFKEEGPREGSFLMLSFWLADVLTQGGHFEEARRTLEEVIAYGNHVGLFAEMLDPKTGEFLGNFPQAFTHMAIVNAVVNLHEAESEASARRPQNRRGPSTALRG